MADDDLLLATTTDSQEAAEGALGEYESDARVPVEQHGSLSEFRHSESEDGNTQTLSYEHEKSSRARYLKHQAKVEEELASLSLPAEPEAEAQTESGNVDIEAVRQAATEDAIAAGRRWAEQQQIAAPQQQYAQLRQQALADFNARGEKIRARNPEEFDRVSRGFSKAGIQYPQEVQDALMTLPGGDEASYYLAANIDQARQIASAPAHLGVAHVSYLAAQLTPKPVSRTPNLPAPIRPVGGSSVPKNYQDPSEMSFSEYKAWREKTGSRRR